MNKNEGFAGNVIDAQSAWLVQGMPDTIVVRCKIKIANCAEFTVKLSRLRERADA